MVRAIAHVLLVAGAAALAWDLTAWMGGAALRLHAIGEAWFVLHRDSLQLAQPAIERHIAPFLWDPVMLSVLESPAAPVLGGLGLALALLTRRSAKAR